MKIFYLTFIITFYSITHSIFPQSNSEKLDEGKITGRVFDKASHHSIEYANVVLLSIIDSSLINGTVTNEKGQFNLTGILQGKYRLEVRFIGYQSKTYNIEITSSIKSIDLGNILLSPNALELKDVVVQGERSPVTYQIDKKVIDVDKIQTVISGNAADVLQNVPSVTVDIDGTVSLRGSSNFTVLIDGKPSIIETQDALQQIPASAIQNIEIITNPSAKYDPGGTAGIINIILRKNEELGLSGVINANVGGNDKYGGDFLFQYNTSDINYILGMDYNERNFPGTSTSRNSYLYDNSISYLNSSGNSERGRTGFGIRAGVEFGLGESDLFSSILRFGTRDSRQNSTLNYSNWSSTNPETSIYQSINNRSRTGNYAGTNLTYTHKFNLKGHQINSEFNFGYRDGDESTLTESISNDFYLEGKNTKEYGPSRDYELKIDYSLPISEVSKFEAGFDGELDYSVDNTELLELDIQRGYYVTQPEYSNSTKYDDNYQAIYSAYNNKYGNLGIQIGLRTEYTYRTITLLKVNQEFQIDRWDYFPTFHTSYKFSEVTQSMASYTRRIERPRGWELEPFYTWMDANNVRIGNPALLPELIDSYETGIQTYVGDISLSVELYHRKTMNKIDRVTSVFSDSGNVNLNSVVNIGNDYSTGSELMLIIDPLQFWNVNLMANLYNYKINGNLYDGPFSRESFNWSTRFNNMFKLGTNTQFQVNLNYNSPGVSAQGKWEGYFRTDVSAKQDLFEKKLSLTLQIRDIFGTSKHESISSGPDFYSYNYHKHQAPMVMLNVRLILNNYKLNQENNLNENSNNPGEEL
jgi:outer membrane receptor protein involved in Fe transport